MLRRRLRWGSGHVAYEVASLTDWLETWAQTLKGKRIAPYWCVNSLWGMGAPRLYYARIPDGNQWNSGVDCFARPRRNAADYPFAGETIRRETRSAPDIMIRPNRLARLARPGKARRICWRSIWAAPVYAHIRRRLEALGRTWRPPPRPIDLSGKVAVVNRGQPGYRPLHRTWICSCRR